MLLSSCQYSNNVLSILLYNRCNFLINCLIWNSNSTDAWLCSKRVFKVLTILSESSRHLLKFSKMFKSYINKCRLVCTTKPGKELSYSTTVCTRFISISCELASIIFSCSNRVITFTMCFEGRSCASSWRSYTLIAHHILRYLIKVACVVNVELFFYGLFLLWFDNTNWVMQNPIQNLDKALLFSRSKVFCLKIWKLRWAPTTLRFNNFCWNFARVSTFAKIKKTWFLHTRFLNFY